MEARFIEKTKTFGRMAKKVYTARWYSTRKDEAEKQADRFRGDGYQCRLAHGEVMVPTVGPGKGKYLTPIRAWIIYVYEPKKAQGQRW